MKWKNYTDLLHLTKVLKKQTLPQLHLITTFELEV
jgi:hypothetical protein